MHRRLVSTALLCLFVSARGAAADDPSAVPAPAASGVADVVR